MVGIVYHDDTKNRPLARKIDDAMAEYARRYNAQPTHICVNPDDLAAAEPASLDRIRMFAKLDAPAPGGFYQQRNTVWVGVS